jgi:hypothetical protein
MAYLVGRYTNLKQKVSKKGPKGIRGVFRVPLLNDDIAISNILRFFKRFQGNQKCYRSIESDPIGPIIESDPIGPSPAIKKRIRFMLVCAACKL